VKLTALSLAVLCIASFETGCQFGRVNQGQVVRFEKEQGLITLIQDSNFMHPNQPRFDVLPAVMIRTPEDPVEMGPAPESGLLLRLDWGGRTAVTYDPGSSGFRMIPFTVTQLQDDVRPDDSRVARKHFPVVNRREGTVTLYSPRDRKWAVLKVDQQYLGLPDETWKFGDEIRYYYKDPRRAIRLMNVTRTDLNAGGK
jgi:hypothetical protein